MIPRADRINTSTNAYTTKGKRALRLWLRLLSCTNMIEQDIARRLRDRFNVTLAQFDVLAELEHAGIPITMTQLSQQLMVSKGNITGLITRLERDALVTRTPSLDDGRVLFIALTERGSTLFTQMAIDHERWLIKLLEELSSVEQDTMVSLLKQTKLSVANHMESS